MAKKNDLRASILEMVAQYSLEEFAEKPFIPGESPVPVSGKVFDSEEVMALVDSALDFWLTTGRYAYRFEREFARYLGVRHAMLCNSGSSANLLALSALTSPKLEDRRLLPGDEVITAAAGFPTTVNPIVQNNLVPVFLDIEMQSYNIDPKGIEDAIGPKTKAIMIAHTLGNPFDVETVIDIARKHNLWVIEDNCDALGSRYNGKLTGTFGDLATVSFYPAHHITMGEGGCVVVNEPSLKVLVESFRDWGRDCWCEPGEDDTCGKRFGWQMGGLPFGYDHKYIYSHIGYNLKLTDLQAAVGVAQLSKLDGFIDARQKNWSSLRLGLDKYSDVLLLPEPGINSQPSWFGFLISVRQDAPFSRNDLVQFLEGRKIATRLLFSGNLTKQPSFESVPYRVVGTLDNTDAVMENTFWIGVYPGITEPMIEYMIDSFGDFMEGS
jgi:CDP-6-deoxy-D-xylo-4-hexulose-3-dehydrase